MLVSDLGEQGLLKLIQPYCLPHSIGDDGAIVRVPPEQELVVTTDVLVDRVHFSDRTTSPVDVGWRSVAANLSDLVAMGAKPLGITVGLRFSPRVTCGVVRAALHGDAGLFDAVWNGNYRWRFDSIECNYHRNYSFRCGKI
jgi:thiamine monophosphate kinase